MDINRNAPAVASAETLIQAPLDVVWAVLSTLTDWSTWNPDVKNVRLEGPVAKGTRFSWKAGGAAISSRFEEVLPGRRLVWSGRTIGIQAVHVWTLEERPGGVRVHTEESFDGLLPRIFRHMMTRMLQRSLYAGLGALKQECERRNRIPVHQDKTNLNNKL
jgi:hypothetical protein